MVEAGATTYNSGTTGGGGAGGYRESPGTASGCYTVSPLGASPAVAALPVSVQGLSNYSWRWWSRWCNLVLVDHQLTCPGTTGTPNSVFSTITSAGGGGGAPDGANCAFWKSSS